MLLYTRNILVLLLFVSKLCSAQSFSTKVSAKSIGKDDILEIQYVAENVEMDQFVLPNFKNWTILSGPNFSSSTMQTGNVVKQQMVYSVLVQPVVTGTLTVPGATALINNKPQRSNTTEITVKTVPHIPGGNPPAAKGNTLSSLFDQFPFEEQVPANQYLKKGESALDRIKNNILVKVEASKRQCYVGEPILVTYKLCTRLRSKSKVTKQPAFTGCTVLEMTENDQEQHLEKIGGIDYNVFVIRKVQLIPLDEGDLLLPEVSVENTVSFYTTGQTNYRDLFYNNPPADAEEQTVTLQNKPLIVAVKHLPPVSSVTNNDFGGAIGNFEISVSAEKSLVSNNTNQLYVTIQGEGNLQQVRPPTIDWPKGIDAFEATEHDESDKQSFPIKSRKVFAFPFVAQYPGNFLLPPISFTFFDATANQYVTRTSNPLHLMIAQGQKSIVTTTNRSSADSDFDTRLYLILGVAFVGIMAGLYWLTKQKRPIENVPAVKPVMPDSETAKPNTEEYLYNIRVLQPEPDSSFFYKMLCKNLHGYIQAKFGIAAGDVEPVVQHSDQLQWWHQLKSLLNDCNVGMYTPVYSIEEAMQHRLKAIEILCGLEGEPGKARNNEGLV